MIAMAAVVAAVVAIAVGAEVGAEVAEVEAAAVARVSVASALAIGVVLVWASRLGLGLDYLVQQAAVEEQENRPCPVGKNMGNTGHIGCHIKVRMENVDTRLVRREIRRRIEG